ARVCIALCAPGGVFGDMTDTMYGFGRRGWGGHSARKWTRLRRGLFGAISKRSGSLRLAAQDVALSRRKQGFESPRERQQNQSLRFCPGVRVQSVSSRREGTKRPSRSSPNL